MQILKCANLPVCHTPHFFAIVHKFATPLFGRFPSVFIITDKGPQVKRFKTFPHRLFPFIAALPPSFFLSFNPIKFFRSYWRRKNGTKGFRQIKNTPREERIFIRPFTF